MKKMPWFPVKFESSDEKKCDDSLFDDASTQETNGCILHMKEGKVAGFHDLLEFLDKRVRVIGIGADFDEERFVRESMDLYAAHNGMPPFASDGPMERLFCEMLHAKCANSEGFEKGISEFMIQIEEHYANGRKELMRLLSTNELHPVSACAGIERLLKLGMLSPEMTFLLLKRNVTPKDIRVWTKTLIPAFVEDWRLYDCEKKRLLNAEQFAAGMCNLHIAELIRNLADDGVCAEVRRIAFEAVMLKMKGLETLGCKVDGDFPQWVRKHIAKKKRFCSVLITFYHAACFVDDSVQGDVGEALGDCLRSGDSEQMAYVRETVTTMLSPTVSAAVANVAKEVSEAFYKREEKRQALAADVSTTASTAACEKTCLETEWQSSAALQRRVRVDAAESSPFKRNALMSRFKEAMTQMHSAHSELSAAKLSMERSKDGTMQSTLSFADAFAKAQAFALLRTQWLPAGDEPIGESLELKIHILRVESGSGKLAVFGKVIDKVADEKLVIAIRTVVEGRVVAVIGDVQLTDDYGAIIRDAQLLEAAKPQIDDFSLAKLYNGAKIERLIAVDFKETSADRMLEAWFRVAGSDSVSHLRFETVTKWFPENPFENQPPEVVDFVLDQIIRWRCDRQDFAETLNFIPAATFQRLLKKCKPYYAPVVRYCERVTYFKEEIAEMLLPTELPDISELPTNWPMGLGTDVHFNALELTVSASARFHCDPPTRVRFVKDKLPLHEPRDDGMTKALGIYEAVGGPNFIVLEALKAPVAK